MHQRDSLVDDQRTEFTCKAVSHDFFIVSPKLDFPVGQGLRVDEVLHNRLDFSGSAAGRVDHQFNLPRPYNVGK